jgi:hypothetical protein
MSKEEDVLEPGIIFIPNLPKQKKLPRKKKKAYVKRMGPNAYRMMLAGNRIITSDYPIINGVVFSPYNKKETRKFKMPSFYSKKTIDSSRYGMLKIEK